MKRMFIRFLCLVLFGVLTPFLPICINKANTNMCIYLQEANTSPETNLNQQFRSLSTIFGIPAQGEKEVRLLELGKPMEREIAGEEVNTYEIMLSVGQFLYVAVEEKNANMVARLYGPDGKLLIEVDTPNATSPMTEQVFWIAETPGKYRIDVSRRRKDPSKKIYIISLKALRDVTTQDRARILAERILFEAQSMEANAKNQMTPDSLLMLAQKYEQAKELFQQSGASDRTLLSLMQLGIIYGTLTKYPKALEIFNEALSLSRSIGDRRREAAALSDIGAMYTEFGDHQRAVDIYLQALPLEKSLGVSSRLTFINLGISNLSLGEYQKALDYFNQAEPQGKSAKGLCSIGTTYFYMSEHQTALDYLNRALEVSRKTNNPFIEAESLTNIGNTYFAMGDFNSALKAFNEVLPLHKKLDDGAYGAATLSLIGEVYQSLRQYQKALDYYNQGLAIARTGSYLAQETEILPKLGDVYRLLGEHQKASEVYTQALHNLNVVPEGKIKALNGLAALALQENHLPEARAQIEAAIKVVESLRTNVASPQLRASFFATKQQPYLFYINLLMQLHKQSPSEGFAALALQANERVHARSLLELLPETRADIRAGADPQLLAKERTLQLLLNGKAESQLQLLNDKDTQKQAEEMKKEMERIQADLEQIQAMIRASSPRYAALTQPQPLTVQEIQQQVLDPDTLLLEYSLGEERSFLWAVTSNAVVGYELPSGKEIEAAATQLYDLMTARQPVRGETPKQYATRLAEADAKYEQQVTKLSQVLLGPVAAQLGSKRLLIVADGALQYVPFAALPVPATDKQNGAVLKTPLIAHHEVINLPSASVLAVMRQETAHRSPATKQVAVVADPVFDKDDDRVQKNASPVNVAAQSDAAIGKRALRDAGLFGDGTSVPRLPFTRQEAEAITAMVSASTTLKALGFKANLATVKNSELSHYRIVHFATHALINTDHPYLSGLLLSLVDEQGKPQDGFLSLNDIYNLNLPADLILLSACQTAKGKEMRGEGLIGLTRGFMYAGAQRVVASLWKVDDAATAELMKRFYRGMFKEGLRPAAALREAQMEMSKQKLWNQPYYWAGFILQGEWK